MLASRLNSIKFTFLTSTQTSQHQVDKNRHLHSFFEISCVEVLMSLGENVGHILLKTSISIQNLGG